MICIIVGFSNGGNVDKIAPSMGKWTISRKIIFPTSCAVGDYLRIVESIMSTDHQMMVELTIHLFLVSKVI